MDTITHGITGALVGKAFFAERYAKPAAVALTLGAVFPDGDVFFNLFARNEFATLEWHRGVTHSFIALPVFAAVLAGISRRWVRGEQAPGFLALWALYALGLAIHIVLDLITSFGTMIWSPLNLSRPAWDLIFIIDFAFSGIVLLPQVVAWIYGEPAGAPRRGALAWVFFSVFAAGAGRLVALVLEVPFPTLVVLVVSGLIGVIFLLPAYPTGTADSGGWGFRQRRAIFCRVGVVLLLGYFALCASSHSLAVKRVEAFARQARLEVRNLAALPAPLSPFRWSGLILTPAGVYQAQFSLLGGHGEEFEFVSSAPPNRYLEIAERLPSVKTFRWFARFPVVSYRSRQAGRAQLHIVEYTDLRFRTPRGGGRWRSTAFTFRVTLNAAGEVLSAAFLES